MRTAFINQLVEEAEKNDKIFLIVGDLGFSVVEAFRDRFPDRFLNAGIAEQNMLGVAAGLALEGYNVYVYSIGNFPTLRCMEQIRYDVAYHNLNVKVVSVGAGYSYGSLGASHHATEEMGMMRTIPNMVICSPSDPCEAREVTRASAHYNGPMYLRLGKAGEKEIFGTSSLTEIGDIHTLQESHSENALIVTGSILSYAAEWVAANNIDTAIYSIPYIKPLNQEQIRAVLNKHGNIITLEEHQKSCGLGSAVVEYASDLYQLNLINRFPKIRRVAIDDAFFSVSGSQSYLRVHAGLTLDSSYFV